MTENPPGSPAKTSAPNSTVPNRNSTSPANNSTTNQGSAKRPPVLTGDTKSGNSAPAADTDLGVEDDEIIKVETNLVTLPVTVLDRDGRFIAGLNKADFNIFEDGVQQKVEYFAALEQPFTVVLLIDVSNSTAFKIEEIQSAAIAFVNQLRQDDRVMVISFDERVHILSQPTNNRAALRNAILRLEFGGGTSLFEAVDHAINQELNKIQGRKAVVLFTDGVDTTSRRASYQSTVREAEEVEAMFYPIRFDTFNDMNGGYSGGGGYPRRGGNSGGGVLGAILGGILNGGGVTIGSGGGGNDAREYEKGKRYLQDLAKISGGRNFEASNAYNLEAAFSGIAEELRRQYSVGYYPETVGQAGQRRQVNVRVARSNAVVRAKNSYIVGENGSNTAKQPNKAPTLRTNGRLPF